MGIDLIGAGLDCMWFSSITDAQLQAAGFGAGQSTNILTEISRVKSEPIDDFKVLASVGIHTLVSHASKQLKFEAQ